MLRIPDRAASLRQRDVRPIPADARILILGAGPGGLSAAHYLRRHGFQNVTVFEKLDRVGGMCCTLTDGRQAVELGAVWIFPDYDELLQIARETGAELEKGGGVGAFTFDDATQTARLRSMSQYLVG